MKFLNEVIENPFDPDRFIKFAGLIFNGPGQSDPVHPDQVRSGRDQSAQVMHGPGQFCREQPGPDSTMPSGSISVIETFKCGEDVRVAVLAVRSENTGYSCQNNTTQRKTISELLASIQCEFAVAAFYEEKAYKWKLSYVKLLPNNQTDGVSPFENRGIKKTSFIMGAGGTLGNHDLSAIANAAAKRQLMNLLRKKGRISPGDIEKAFSCHVFTRNVIKAFNRRYPDALDLSAIIRLPGFKMDESEPFDRELAVDPEMLGNIFLSRLKNRDRKNRGTFYTPSETVSFMCRESLAQYISNATELSYEDCLELLAMEGTAHDPEGTAHDPEAPAFDQVSPAQAQRLIPGKPVRRPFGVAAESLIKIDRALQQVRIFDPAAGSGAFVLGMLKEIARVRSIISFCISEGQAENRIAESRACAPGAEPNQSAGKNIYELMRHTVRNCIFAADTDEEAVRLTKLRLWCALASVNYGGPSEPEQFCHVACCDSLSSSADTLKDDPAFEGVISEKGGFDIVIGNPPYISAVEDARYGNPLRDSLKAKYPILKGSFDIYTAFLLEGVRQTNKEGVYCWIVPNSLLSSSYALPVLEYLKRNGLNRSISVSDIDIFHNVGVYPVIAIGNKKEKGNGYSEYIAASADNPGCAAARYSAGHSGYGTFKDYGVRIASGASGFQAKALAGCISEGDKDLAIPFVVSGSIDKYSTSFSNVRYMGKTWSRAFITKSGDIAQSKWRLWCGEKIIIAGLTRELEADYSREPLALGVGAYAIYDFGGFEPLYLLGLLNSRFMSEYLRDRFYEKHLAGGYLVINKTTLEQLPLVPADREMQETIAEKAGAVKAVMQQLNGKKVKLQCKALLDEIDELVDQLFAYHHFR